MNDKQIFYIGDKIFDKWHSTEWRIEEIGDFAVMLVSTERETRKLIVQPSTLRDSERFIKLIER